MTKAPNYRPGVPCHRCCNWKRAWFHFQFSVPVAPVATPRQLQEAIFFFNSWKHSSSLAVHLQGVVFLIRSVRGAEE